ncbi:MAG: hypothetical protein G3M70_13510 [Candidatus Nitronauta litoralis]|uniref:Uncharacterized protein n=1 Tax=Candidatus Nitronauta litoralis TaxID=2705533 RepID=A0A7T0G1D6_9BACT|nr:MAG: hypothetical protein G3M70_13510 [Candidatus Nitronauta litoralis]
MPGKSLTFHSTVLHKSIRETDSTFNQYLKSLDTISNDIRNLENYLREKGVTHNFSYFAGSYLPEEKASFITWRYCESAKKYRLFYTVMVWNDPDDEFNKPTQESIEWEKPLIETESAIRMSVFPALPEFIKSLAEEVKVLQRKAVVSILGTS